jgi:hypothetical protein
MKVFDLASGVSTLLSNEEHQLVQTIANHGGMIAKHELDDRQKMLASQLVNRAVLTRVHKKRKICYVLCDQQNIWRI